jgi:hypothetical protein
VLSAKYPLTSKNSPPILRPLENNVLSSDVALLPKKIISRERILFPSEAEFSYKDFCRLLKQEGFMVRKILFFRQFCDILKTSLLL